MTTKTIFFFLIPLFILVSCNSTPGKPAQPTTVETFALGSLPTATITITNTPVPETVVFEESISPNGEWTGIVTLQSKGASKDLLFKVSNNFNNQVWVIEEMEANKEDYLPHRFIYPY
ncbi:MAG: hypothetical protein KDD72_08655, partial [Anaerolineales bacterium]|nr:hypothetical protein [Anaerolineales bacterium]